MATQKIQLTESQLREMTKDIILEAIENGEIDENWFGDMIGGAKNAAKSTLDAITQRGNKFMADVNAGAAQNAKQEIEKQIEKSKAVIKQEQEKINALRTKYNQYVQNADSYIEKANKKAEKRGSNTRYNDYGLPQDNNTQDFHTNDELNKAVKKARTSQAFKTGKNVRKNLKKQGWQEPQSQQQPANGNGQKKMQIPNKPQAAMNESINLRNIIREAINNVL